MAFIHSFIDPFILCHSCDVHIDMYMLKHGLEESPEDGEIHYMPGRWLRRKCKQEKLSLSDSTT